MKQSQKLSSKTIAALPEGRWGDGDGLYMRVTDRGRFWIYRYQIAGKQRDLGLGSFPGITLAQARKAAGEARAMVKAVIPQDPVALRRAAKDQQRAERAARITFKEAADKYIAGQRSGWRNAKHGQQWVSTLETYAFPIIGSLAVAEIATAHVVAVLEKDNFWENKTETANRTRGRIEAVLDWSRTRGYRAGENPARWRGHLEHSFQRRSKLQKVEHLAAMAYVDVPAFAAELHAVNSVAARGLEFAVLTAARTGEVREAQWQEIDLAAKVWCIPAERTKANRTHRIPLSGRAVQLLQAMPHEKGSDFVFPGIRPRKPISEAALLDALRFLRADVSVHGFRSSFRDWAAEQTNYARDVCEAALGHASGDKVEDAYRRTDQLAKRARLMQEWANYLANPPKAVTNNVTPIRHGA